jgi:carbamoyltransferase
MANLPPYDIADCAFTGQLIFEEKMEQLLTNLAKLGVSKNLVLSGGCALNSSMNGKIVERTPFENLYVFCAPADDGNALGAALLAYNKDHPGKLPTGRERTPYLGSTMSEEKRDHLRRFGNFARHSTWPGKIHEKAAQLLADGKIIGWVQGRAEFGPRALGNRSILADPRRPDIKNRLNDRVKFREEFRPFAPSILHEYGPEYFENYQESPYMERTLRFKADVVERVPGVVHVNRTGRLQTVKREWNEKYYALIEAFYRITGIPLLLNTSFNVMGKPIVHSVEDAIAVFSTCGLDALVLEDDLIEK